METVENSKKPYVSTKILKIFSTIFGGESVESDWKVFHREIHMVFHTLSAAFPQTFPQKAKKFYPLISLIKAKISNCAFFFVFRSISTLSIEDMMVE